MRARFQLRTLGEPALATMGGRPVKLRTKKQVALLCYLAVARRWHTRDALAELLWPDGDFAKSRHSLAVALSYLRGKLGRDILETVQERVRLHPDGIELDVDRLLRGDVLGSDTDMPLDVDGFLEGFEVPNALPFAHWRDGERARLLPNVLDALVILIDRCRRTGDFRQIETLGLRLQRFEPLSEHAMRARMEARAFAGDRLTALRLFEQWKAALDEQLQAAPSDLLEGMALRLRRRGWERPGSADIPTVHTDQWKDRPFVGRTREYRELYEAWEAAQRCEASHRLVLGDSGIGKSTLVERVTTAAGLEGATVARVQCHEAEREIPYAAVSGLIAQLVERPGASATPPEALAELAQTIPVVRQRFPVLPPPIESQGDAARIRFTEASHALIAAVAEEHPVILVVDDVHHADDVSLAVLHRVVRLADKQPVLLFFLARLGELNQSPQAARLRDHGASLNIHQLTLSTLSREESGELLDGLLKDLELTASPTVRRTLLGAAAGYPLVLELLVRDWARSGDRSLAMALDAVTAEVAAEETADAYGLLVGRLIGDMDPVTRNVLNIAAILGTRLNEIEMYSLADLKTGEVLTGLTRLCTLRITRDAGSHIEFANDLVRAHAYQAVPAPMRKHLHHCIATELISRALPGDALLALDIAWHLMRAGQHHSATEFLLRGGSLAIERGAIHEAERRLQSALPSLSGAAHMNASVLLAELLQEEARYSESQQVLARYECDPTPHVEALLRIADIATNELSALYEQHLDRAASLLGTEISRKASIAAVRLASHLVRARLSVDDAAFLHDLMADPRFDSWEGDDALELAAQRIYVAYYAALPNAGNEETLERLVDLIRSTDAMQRANQRSFRLISGAALCHKRAGRYEEAKPFLDSALTIARRLDNRCAISYALGNLASWAGEMGAVIAQRDFGMEAVRIGECYSPFSVLLHRYSASTACALLGDELRATDLALGLRAVRDLSKDDHYMAMFFEADVHWLLGNNGQAMTLAKQALRLAVHAPQRWQAQALIHRWLSVMLRSHPCSEWIEMARATLEASKPIAELWDESERLASAHSMACTLGCKADKLNLELDVALERLPFAAQEHLRRFDLLPKRL